MEDELKQAWKEAFSIQSSPENAVFTYIGDLEEPDGWIYRFYRDQNGKYWFQCYIKNGSVTKTLHEWVHGKPEKEWWLEKTEAEEGEDYEQEQSEQTE